MPVRGFPLRPSPRARQPNPSQVRNSGCRNLRSSYAQNKAKQTLTNYVHTKHLKFDAIGQGEGVVKGGPKEAHNQ